MYTDSMIFFFFFYFLATLLIYYFNISLCDPFSLKISSAIQDIFFIFAQWEHIQKSLILILNGCIPLKFLGILVCPLVKTLLDIHCFSLVGCVNWVYFHLWLYEHLCHHWLDFSSRNGDYLTEFHQEQAIMSKH